MGVAVRVMGNLVTDEDEDWSRGSGACAGRLSRRIDDRPPFS